VKRLAFQTRCTAMTFYQNTTILTSMLSR